MFCFLFDSISRMRLLAKHQYRQDNADLYNFRLFLCPSLTTMALFRELQIHIVQAYPACKLLQILQNSISRIDIHSAC